MFREKFYLHYRTWIELLASAITVSLASALGYLLILARL
jgi:hypothetical protein